MDMGSRHASWRDLILPALAALAGGALSVPAAAQVAGDVTATEAPCKSLMQTGRDGTQTLSVACDGTGFVLGPSDKATLIFNPALKATLVDTIWREERRFWLVGTAADGSLYLQELSGTIALAGGRGARMDPTGLMIDLTRFAETGLVTVEPERGADAAAGATGKVDLAALVKLTADRRTDTGTADSGTADGQTAG